MRDFDWKRFAILVFVMLINIFLVWFGIKLLKSHPQLTDTQYFLIGCGCVVGGLYALTSEFLPFGIGFIFLGMYFFARGSGLIASSWLSKIAGIVSIAAAIVLTFVAVRATDRSD